MAPPAFGVQQMQQQQKNNTARDASVHCGSNLSHVHVDNQDALFVHDHDEDMGTSNDNFTPDQSPVYCVTPSSSNGSLVDMARLECSTEEKEDCEGMDLSNHLGLDDSGSKECDTALVENLLELHGSPSDPSDQFKTLEQIMLDSERDICIFAGAIELLKQQLTEAKRGASCPVCARNFGNSRDYDNCLDQIDIKMSETEAARKSSRVVEIYSNTKIALCNGLKVNGFMWPTNGTVHGKKFESRVSFNMRNGSLTELRNQKAECLQDQMCFACLRSLQGDQVVDYLQRVDRNASQMQDRLHVHN